MGDVCGKSQKIQDAGENFFPQSEAVATWLRRCWCDSGQPVPEAKQLREGVRGCCRCGRRRCYVTVTIGDGAVGRDAVGGQRRGVQAQHVAHVATLCDRCHDEEDVLRSSVILSHISSHAIQVYVMYIKQGIPALFLGLFNNNW